MVKEVVIPGVDPESSLFNSSCNPYLNLDSRFTMRCPGMIRKGFTLIELLVVVLIIGILSAVALPQYTKAVEKSRAVQAVVLVKSIRDAAEVYYMANGTYPSSIDDLDIERPAMVKDFEWDDIAEWKYGRFSLQHTSPYYLIIASGAERTSSAISVELLKGKVYCWSANTKGLQMCKSIGVREVVEGRAYGGQFWEL